MWGEKSTSIKLHITSWFKRLICENWAFPSIPIFPIQSVNYSSIIKWLFPRVCQNPSCQFCVELWHHPIKEVLFFCGLCSYSLFKIKSHDKDSENCFVASCGRFPQTPTPNKELTALWQKQNCKFLGFCRKTDSEFTHHILCTCIQSLKCTLRAGTSDGNEVSENLSERVHKNA